MIEIPDSGAHEGFSPNLAEDCWLSISSRRFLCDFNKRPSERVQIIWVRPRNNTLTCWWVGEKNTQLSYLGVVVIIIAFWESHHESFKNIPALSEYVLQPEWPCLYRSKEWFRCRVRWRSHRYQTIHIDAAYASILSQCLVVRYIYTIGHSYWQVVSVGVQLWRSHYNVGYARFRSVFIAFILP